MTGRRMDDITAKWIVEPDTDTVTSRYLKLWQLDTGWRMDWEADMANIKLRQFVTDTSTMTPFSPLMDCHDLVQKTVVDDSYYLMLNSRSEWDNFSMLEQTPERRYSSSVSLSPSQVFKSTHSVVSQTQSPTAGMQTASRHADMKAVKVNVTSRCEIPHVLLTAASLPLLVRVYNCTWRSHQLTQKMFGCGRKEAGEG